MKDSSVWNTMDVLRKTFFLFEVSLVKRNFETLSEGKMLTPKE